MVVQREDEAPLKTLQVARLGTARGEALPGWSRFAAANAHVVSRHVGQYRGLFGFAQLETPRARDQPFFWPTAGGAYGLATGLRSAVFGIIRSVAGPRSSAPFRGARVLRSTLMQAAMRVALERKGSAGLSRSTTQSGITKTGEKGHGCVLYNSRSI